MKPTAIARLTMTLLLLAVGGSSALAQQRAPQIVFAEAPALLVQIDGAPVYRRIPDTDLSRVANTTALIVRDDADLHYLKVFDGWMESYGLLGDWSISGVSPFGEHAQIERAALDQTPNRLDGHGLDRNPPAVFVVTAPAALIITDGPQRWQAVAGSTLTYLANTAAKVFREPTDDECYVRVGTDWYRSWSVDGPWQFLAANDLPSDIARQLAK